MAVSTKDASANSDDSIIGMEVDITIIAGKDLVVKDKKMFGKGSSDPYVVLHAQTASGQRSAPVGRTPHIEKNLNPQWNWSNKLHLGPPSAFPELRLCLFDRDALSKDDPMGEVTIPLAEYTDGHVRQKWYPVHPTKQSKDAKGELHVKVTVLLRHAISIHPGETQMVPPNATLAVGMGWELMKGGHAIDLDTACVCVGITGEVLMDETVYFGQLHNPNGSIRHTGDERTGEADLGQGDDEIIMCDLAKIPPKVAALFFIGTVADDGRNFSDVKSCRIRLVDWASGVELCRYVPALKGAHTAIFMARVSRDGPQWKLAAIGEVDHTARDFGSLIPEIKGYMRDLNPKVRIDMNERIAIMRKGGNIRLKDYNPNVGVNNLMMGLAWDVTNGVNIDLDASVILLDAKLTMIDLVYFGKLRSSDGSIQHCGDEREGDEEGDDEKVILNLAAVHPAVCYIGFVVNSYSGQELDDVAGASCHLFDQRTGRDLAQYTLTGTKMLDKRTALVMGMLFRADPSADWCLRIISEAAMGRTAHDNVDELQNHIKRDPPRPPPPAVFGGGMPGGGLAGMGHGGGGMMSASGRIPVPTSAPQMSVTAPPGVGGGQQMQVMLPDGGAMVVIVPAGTPPGGTFLVNAPHSMPTGVPMGGPPQGGPVIMGQMLG